MTLKSWVLDHMHQLGKIGSRADLPPRERTPPTTGEHFAAPARQAGEAGRAHGLEPTFASNPALGAYAPLIAAIRTELEHFVASQVRLHLAIAERDRFLLTSIDVNCPGGGATHQLLTQFMHEFKPEQVKRYVVREVIGGLPNAGAIDLSQFEGLCDADKRDDPDDDGDYRELMALLATSARSAPLHRYEVTLLGRWAETDAALSAAASHSSPVTPLAGQRCEFEVEDGDGRRGVVLQSVLPGRRYVVGKGEGCDIRVNGNYTSRRHAEVWLENGAWWAIDADSTNGIRVDLRDARQGAAARPAVADAARQPIRLVAGARMVLSALAEGPASDYPWIALRPAAPAAARVTPIAGPASVPKTPLTAIRPAGADLGTLKITALQASGMRTLELHPASLPVHVGRSRNQTLVVDRRHEAVSGHHLDIVGLDESGAQLVVHGDNGVLIEGVLHAAGAHIRWKTGETMVLGASAENHPTCTLMLARASRD